jgi:hypothetical protein
VTTDPVAAATSKASLPAHALSQHIGITASTTSMRRSRALCIAVTVAFM